MLRPGSRRVILARRGPPLLGREELVDLGARGARRHCEGEGEARGEGPGFV
uniref:Uncharacterized protein n=1 Tax=Arundo donax TaxID=35708 RepID=A0A0A9B2D6_ARUDO